MFLIKHFNFYDSKNALKRFKIYVDINHIYISLEIQIKILLGHTILMYCAYLYCNTIDDTKNSKTVIDQLNNTGPKVKNSTLLIDILIKIKY